MKVNELKPRAAVDSIVLEIVSKADPRDFATEKATGRVCNCAAKDETGEVKLTLWNEQIDQIKEGDTIKIENGWVSEFRGEKQIGTGRNGTLNVLK